MAVEVSKLVVGKKYRYDDTLAGGVDWFVNGSIVTITRLDGTGSPVATGPGKRDNVGGTGRTKGEDIKGYAPAQCLFEIIADGVTFEDTSRTIETTTITVDRKLTDEEKIAIANIVEKGSK